MKWIIIILFLLPFGLFAKPNAIDSLKTDEDVSRFLSKHYDGDRRINFLEFSFNPASGNPILDHLYDSLVTQKWAKGDFDHNGEKDIVVSGFYDLTYYVYLVLAKPEHKFEFHDLQMRFDVILPKFIKKRDQDLILAYHVDRTKKYADTILIDSDTLIYKYNCLIEYNSHPLDLHFDSLELSVSYPMDFSGLPPNIIVLANGSARYRVASDQGKKYFGVQKLDRMHFNQILELVNYIKMNTLNTSYFARATDMSSAVITFYFGGNRKIHIRDYGMQGTYGLAALYRLILDLPKNQNWIPETK
jgi:hypothetical protein